LNIDSTIKKATVFANFYIVVEQTSLVKVIALFCIKILTITADIKVRKFSLFWCNRSGLLKNGLGG